MAASIRGRTGRNNRSGLDAFRCDAELLLGFISVIYSGGAERLEKRSSSFFFFFFSLKAQNKHAQMADGSRVQDAAFLAEWSFIFVTFLLTERCIGH